MDNIDDKSASSSSSTITPKIATRMDPSKNPERKDSVTATLHHRHHSALPVVQHIPAPGVAPATTAYYGGGGYYLGGGGVSAAYNSAAPYYGYGHQPTAYHHPQYFPHQPHQAPVPAASRELAPAANTTTKEERGNSTSSSTSQQSMIMAYLSKCLDEKEEEMKKLQSKMDTLQTKLKEESVAGAEIKIRFDNRITQHENEIQMLKFQHQQELKKVTEETSEANNQKLEEYQHTSEEQLQQLQEKIGNLQSMLREESVACAEIKSKLDSEMKRHGSDIDALKMQHRLDLEQVQNENSQQFAEYKQACLEECQELQDKSDELQSKLRAESVALEASKSKLGLTIMEHEKEMESMILKHQQELEDVKKEMIEIGEEEKEASSVSYASLEKSLQDKEHEITKLTLQLEQQTELSRNAKSRANHFFFHCKDLTKENQTLRRLTLRLHSQLAWFYGLTSNHNTTNTKSKRAEAEPRTPEDGSTGDDTISGEEERKLTAATGIRFEAGDRPTANAIAEDDRVDPDEVEVDEEEQGQAKCELQDQQQEPSSSSSASPFVEIATTGPPESDDGVAARSDDAILDSDHSNDIETWITDPDHTSQVVDKKENDADCLEKTQEQKQDLSDDEDETPTEHALALSHRSVTTESKEYGGPSYWMEENDVRDDAMELQKDTKGSAPISDGDDSLVAASYNNDTGKYDRFDGPSYMDEDEEAEDGPAHLMSTSVGLPEGPRLSSCGENESHTIKDRIKESMPPLTGGISASGRDGGGLIAGGDCSCSTATTERKEDTSVLPSIGEEDNVMHGGDYGGMPIPIPPQRRYNTRTPSPRYSIPKDVSENDNGNDGSPPVIVGVSPPSSPSDGVLVENTADVNDVTADPSAEISPPLLEKEDFYHMDEPLSPTPKLWKAAYDFLEGDDDHENLLEKRQSPTIPPPEGRFNAETSVMSDDPTYVSSTHGDPRQKVYEKFLRDPYGDMGFYTGTVLQSTQMPHGSGRMIYEEPGREYQGDWRHGRWHGQGHAIFSNGDSYQGEYRYDQRHGRGVYMWADGRVYEGPFSEDKRHGHGIFRWPDGAVYEGDYDQGQRHGYGKYTFAAKNSSSNSKSSSTGDDDDHDDRGGQYEGEWKHGRYDGVGTCTWGNGRCYRGEWKNGMMDGKGVEINPDGSVHHDGLWKMDKPRFGEF